MSIPVQLPSRPTVPFAAAREDNPGATTFPELLLALGAEPSSKNVDSHPIATAFQPSRTPMKVGEEPLADTKELTAQSQIPADVPKSGNRELDRSTTPKGAAPEMGNVLAALGRTSKPQAKHAPDSRSDKHEEADAGISTASSLPLAVPVPVLQETTVQGVVPETTVHNEAPAVPGVSSAVTEVPTITTPPLRFVATSKSPSTEPSLAPETHSPVPFPSHVDETKSPTGIGIQSTDAGVQRSTTFQNPEKPLSDILPKVPDTLSNETPRGAATPAQSAQQKSAAVADPRIPAPPTQKMAQAQGSIPVTARETPNRTLTTARMAYTNMAQAGSNGIVVPRESVSETASTETTDAFNLPSAPASTVTVHVESNKSASTSAPNSPADAGAFVIGDRPNVVEAPPARTAASSDLKLSPSPKEDGGPLTTATPASTSANPALSETPRMPVDTVIAERTTVKPSSNRTQANRPQTNRSSVTSFNLREPIVAPSAEDNRVVVPTTSTSEDPKPSLVMAHEPDANVLPHEPEPKHGVADSTFATPAVAPLPSPDAQVTVDGTRTIMSAPASPTPTRSVTTPVEESVKAQAHRVSPRVDTNTSHAVEGSVKHDTKTAEESGTTPQNRESTTAEVPQAPIPHTVAAPQSTDRAVNVANPQSSHTASVAAHTPVASQNSPEPNHNVAVAPGTSSPNVAPDRERAYTLVESARLVERAASTEMRVGVHTPELGKVEVHASLRDNSVGATLSVERPEIQRMFASELPNLNRTLDRHQVELQSVSLMDSSMQQPGGQARQEQQPPQRQSWQQAGESVSPSPDGSRPHQSNRSSKVSSSPWVGSGLDLLA